MPLDATEVRVGITGTLYFAPIGSTMPTGVTAAPDAAFLDVGYLTEDGVTFAPTVNSEGVMAWQTLYEVRRIVTERAAEVSFVCRQRNPEVLKRAFGGGAITEPTPGVFKFTPPAPEFVDEVAMLLEVKDGAVTDRYCFPRVLVTSVEDVPFKRDENTTYGLTVSILAPASGDVWWMLSNDANLDPAP